MTPVTTARMPLRSAIAALHAARHADDVVITTMGAAREWMALGTSPLDFVFLPSSMGQATSLGLGIALARPDRRVIVANGDGSMLMNLGSLVTIAAAGPRNLVIIVLANGVYEVTGAQPLPGTQTAQSPGASVDFMGLARASGIRAVLRFADVADWTAKLPDVLRAEGPVFVLLDVAPVPGAPGPRSPGPGAVRARAFRDALAARTAELPAG
jgi:thiamine pyrophosphate-dependent acetolactate synthase large subunit-like protein